MKRWLVVAAVLGVVATAAVALVALGRGPEVTTASPDALAEFEERLATARQTMPAWRRPETEAEWAACAAGIDEALLRARRLREEAPDLGGFEGLIWNVENLLDPLDPFEAAVERFRSLRVVVR